MTDVSVIIPVSGDGRFLHKAIVSALNQGVHHSEICVVANGVSDSLLIETKKNFGSLVKLVRFGQPIGPAEARNIGCRETTSQWIRFLDSDDEFSSNSHDFLIGKISNAQNEIGVGVTQTISSLPINSNQLSRAIPAIGAVVISRYIWDKVGEFNPKLQMGEFVDWIVRSRRLGVKEIKTENIVLFRRFHESNYSKAAFAKGAQDYLSIVKNHMSGK